MKILRSLGVLVVLLIMLGLGFMLGSGRIKIDLSLKGGAEQISSQASYLATANPKPLELWGDKGEAAERQQGQGSSEAVQIDFGQNISESDAQCATMVFNAYGISPLNVVQAGGADGSPSATLALVGVISSAEAIQEFDNTYGRTMTIRGGETGQIQSTSPTEVIIVLLSENGREYVEYYTQPDQDIVEEGGEALDSMGVEILHGVASSFDLQLYRDDSIVAAASGSMRIIGDVGTVLRDASILEGWSDFSMNNLRGFGVPAGSDGCYHMHLSITVPENRLLGLGIGTFQIRYTGVADYIPPSR